MASPFRLRIVTPTATLKMEDRKVLPTSCTVSDIVRVLVIFEVEDKHLVACRPADRRQGISLEKSREEFRDRPRDLDGEHPMWCQMGETEVEKEVKVGLDGPRDLLHENWKVSQPYPSRLNELFLTSHSSSAFNWLSYEGKLTLSPVKMYFTM